MATTDLSGDRIAAWRLECFLELGFTRDQARELVEVRGTDGFKLSHHDVRRYLALDATRDQIMRIFT